MDNWSFYGKTIFMWSLVLVLALLDAFVPDSFYDNFINQIHVFKWMSICLMLSGLIGSIICKFNKKEELYE